MISWLYRLIYGTPKSGSLPQPVDSRDYSFEKSFKAGSLGVKTIPSLYDFGSLPDQKDTNACVGFSLARLVEILIYQVVKEETGDDYYYKVSEKFFWDLARIMEETEDENVGVFPRDAFKALFKYGYLPYEELPFNNSHEVLLSDYEYRVASVARDMLVNMKFKYYAVNKSTAVSIVKKGQAVAVALPINNSWYFNRYAKDEKPNGSGYHYMVLEGVFVKDGVEYCKFANSWGKGYLYVPKSYFDKYAQDLWTLAAK